MKVILLGEITNNPPDSLLCVRDKREEDFEEEEEEDEDEEEEIEKYIIYKQETL